MGKGADLDSQVIRIIQTRDSHMKEYAIEAFTQGLGLIKGHLGLLTQWLLNSPQTLEIL